MSEKNRKKFLQRKRRRDAPYVQWYRTPQWRAARAAFLAQNPFCCRCGGEAAVVDHREPHRGDPALFWDRSRWQALCSSCHNRKTAQQDGGFGNESREFVSAACDADGRPLDPTHPWNGGGGRGA